MEYTFIKDDNEITVDIPEDIISKHKRTLGCSTKEAIELYLFDEGYIDNEIVRELTNKAYKNKPKKSNFNIKSRMNSKNVKQEMIEKIYDCLHCNLTLDSTIIENIVLSVDKKKISIYVDNDVYDITLVKKRS